MSKRKKRTAYGLEGVRKKVAPIADIILKGEVLAIDPSIISSSSNPGWALYRGGKLKKTGIISGIDPRRSVEERLQFLGKYCREKFDEPDVFVIEHIQMGGKIFMESTIRASGAIISNFECEHVISIAPLAWQAYIEKKIPLGEGSDYIKYKVYKEQHKSDEKDAEMIGLAVIEIAKELTKG